MSDNGNHTHDVPLKGGEIALGDLGYVLPGMADVMPLIGTRIWKCYYAAQAHNKPLARFELEEASILMEKGAVLRSKYAEDMEIFIADLVGPLKKAIEAEDWDGFEALFTGMVDGANSYHEKYEKGFLRWKLPDQPPPDLDMNPIA